MPLTLRCRGPSGQCTLSGVEPDMSTQTFLDLLSEKTGVPAASMEVLTGFPPKAIEIPADGTVSSLALANGDTLTVRSGAAPTPAPAAPLAGRKGGSSSANSYGTTQGTGGTAELGGLADEDEDEDEMLARAIAASLEGVPTEPAGHSSSVTGISPGASGQRHQQQHKRQPEEGGGSGRAVSNGPTGGGPAPQSMAVPGGGGSCVVRRVIDSDNSCLFNAVAYVMDRSRTHADALRKVVAQVVSSDPIIFNEGFLGKDVQEYCGWIQQRDKWGGAIELFILSQYYGREIAAFDIQTKRCDVYGQDMGYDERVLLIYDGLHYDALAVAAFEGAPEELDVTMFRQQSREGEAIMVAAEKLVAAAHAARQFTNIANFTLRCGICQIGLKGEKEAVEHAKATGHSNFAEF